VTTEDRVADLVEKWLNEVDALPQSIEDYIEMLLELEVTFRDELRGRIDAAKESA
tara:strand:- start:321 stop:485 length:165 start_codon:yes stop_codon:yes gene_type:complete